MRDQAAVTALATALIGFEADRRMSFEAALASPDHDVIVAEVDGEVVGFAHLLAYHDLSHGALAGELLGLVVRADMRRQRIGSLDRERRPRRHGQRLCARLRLWGSRWADQSALRQGGESRESHHSTPFDVPATTEAPPILHSRHHWASTDPPPNLHRSSTLAEAPGRAE